MTHLVTHGWQAALEWLFPATCALCSAPGNALCVACRRDVAVGLEHACHRCAIPLPARVHEPGHVRLCGRCLRRMPAYDRTLAAARYEAPFDQLIRGLKYGATLAYVPLLADLIEARTVAARATGWPGVDVLVPVPLSRERMATRGFNQSIEIAKVVARRIGVPLDASGVLRIHDTLPQASLPLDARRRNVRGAFAVIDAQRSRLRDLHVGVVDDVMTTGATLDELARTLKRAGAKTVCNLVAARTP